MSRKDYKYYKGEESNPFTSEDDIAKNKHMWWHYEQHYFIDKNHQNNIQT